MMKVVKIEQVPDEEFVYDPCCEEHHTYSANGFVSHNCILWIDEIEKGLSGTRSSGQTDGGTTSRVVSTFLTWMQEKTAHVFVYATANDYTQIPPEFMRAGRFDEIFFVDLPNRTERKQIFEVILRRNNREHLELDTEALAKMSDGYSGAEIEKMVVQAMFAAYEDEKRDITIEDMIEVKDNFQPLSVMREEDFEGMRQWGEQNCVKANEEEGVSSYICDNQEPALDI